MNTISQEKILGIMTLLLAASLTVVSIFGAFVPSTYERDALSMGTQAIGQDIVDLFFVVPLLIVTWILMRKNSKSAFFIYGGTVAYILYSFFIYSFGVHFNRMFLLYCLTLGLSLYVFILFISAAARQDIQDWFSDHVPTRPIGIYLLMVSALFYLLWFKSIIPALLNNSIPKDVSNAQLLVNPVHVLDIAIVLPGLICTAVLLMKKHRTGYILAPIFLVFTIILAVALIGMVLMLKIKGLIEDPTVAAIFMVLAAISSLSLLFFFKQIKAP